MAHSSKMAINKFLKLIQAEHQKYFVSDDEVLNEEKYQRLRQSVKKYLEFVQNDNKFTCDSFAQLFKYNFERNHDFNVKDAQQAFDNLQKYASNLMSFPWRKEFHSIKLYCGFFKHQVARHLLKADMVLRLMGYNPNVNSASSLILDEPPDPDKLIMVSLNCLIASCECEVICDIYTQVKNNKCTCTHKEIYMIRKTISLPQAIAQSFCSKDRLETSGPIISKFSSKTENGSLHQLGKNDKNLKRDVKVGQLIDISPITTSTPETKKKQLLPDDLYEAKSTRTKDYMAHRSSQTNNSFNHKKLENDGNVYANVGPSERKTKLLIDESDGLKFQDDHVKSSATTVRDHRKNQESEELHATRDASWGYVDKTLQSRGLARSYANDRNDVLEDAEPTKIEKELEMLRRKSREPEQLQQFQQLQLQQMQQEQLSHFHANSVVQPNPSEYMQLGGFPPAMPPHMLPTMMPPSYPYVNNPYFYNHEMMRNTSFPRGMHPMPEFTPEMQHWLQMRNQYLGGMYYPPSSTSAPDGSATVPNNFVSAMHALNLNDNSTKVENGTRSHEATTPLSDPSEENRRSVYDNVPHDRDGRAVPDLYSGSSFLPGMLHPSSMMYMARSPPMAVHAGRPVEMSDYRSTESRELLHRKDSQSLTDEQVESDNSTSKSKNQLSKTRNKLDNSESHYSGSSDKEKSSPMQRRSRSDIPSVHSSKRNSQCSTPSEAGGWECKHCTFYNTTDKKICDMCGRSKAVGPESRPLQCGGHECPKCTLINDQSVFACVACGTNLANSPTYL